MSLTITREKPKTSELITVISEYDISSVLAALAEVADSAATLSHHRDAQLIRSILSKIEN